MAELNIEKDMSGLLFSVDSKNENAPQWSGKIKVNDKEYEVAAWENKAKSGQTYMSLKIQEPREPLESGAGSKPIAGRQKPTRR